MMQLPPQVPNVQSFGQVPVSGAEGPARSTMTMAPQSDAILQQLRAPTMPGGAPGGMPVPTPVAAPQMPPSVPGNPGMPGGPRRIAGGYGGRGKSGPAPRNFMARR